MIQHVYERASAAQGIAEVIVATDDKRIVRLRPSEARSA